MRFKNTSTRPTRLMLLLRPGTMMRYLTAKFLLNSAAAARYSLLATFRRRIPDGKWFVVVIRQGREWNHPDVLDEEPYELVVTVADRDNEDAHLYTQIQIQIQTLIAQQAEIRERRRPSALRVAVDLLNGLRAL